MASSSFNHQYIPDNDTSQYMDFDPSHFNPFEQLVYPIESQEEIPPLYPEIDPFTFQFAQDPYEQQDSPETMHFTSTPMDRETIHPAYISLLYQSVNYLQEINPTEILKIKQKIDDAVKNNASNEVFQKIQHDLSRKIAKMKLRLEKSEKCLIKSQTNLSIEHSDSLIPQPKFNNTHGMMKPLPVPTTLLHSCLSKTDITYTALMNTIHANFEDQMSAFSTSQNK